MRLQRRNTVTFGYKARTGEAEVLNGTMHTGDYEPTYAAPVWYKGNLSVPSSFATANLFGINTNYTHILLLDNPEADIAEDGRVICGGDEYEIRAVRPSLNVLSVALRKLTKDHSPAEPDPESEEPVDPTAPEEPDEPALAGE